MDESALFWKMAPDGTLGTDQGAEGEHGKARITISLACNVTGSHKLEPWFIGKARVPRSFGGSSIKIKDFLDYVAEQQESLDDWESLYGCGLIGRWQVDKLSCWLMALGTSCWPRLISRRVSSNTNVNPLPPPVNSTSICKPLDQATIKAWKAQYRKKWVRFLCSEYGKDKDPLKTINALQAIRWSIEAWGGRITIENCWVKAKGIWTQSLGLRIGEEGKII